MKQGANRRTSAELCIIRLCTPSLDTDVNAILRRLSELESAIKSGNIPVKAEPVSVPVTEEPKEEIKVQETKPEPKPEPKKEEPKPVAPPVKEEKVQPAPQQTGTIAFDRWPEVLDKLYENDKSLIVMLSGSSAFVHQDKYLLIKGSPVLEMYLKTGEYSKIIKQAVLDVTGKNYTLAVYNNKQEEAPKNPLSDLVSKAKQLGVNIEEDK
jgi:hypothetical protein